MSDIPAEILSKAKAIYEGSWPDPVTAIAEALMEARREPTSFEGSATIVTWINKHLSKMEMLPKRVDEMTETEAEIFKIAAYHTGFLQFLSAFLSRPEAPNIQHLKGNQS